MMTATFVLWLIMIVLAVWLTPLAGWLKPAVWLVLALVSALLVHARWLVLHAALPLALLVAASGCNATLAANLERAQLGVMAATEIAQKATHAECGKRAMACGALKPPPATCVQKEECQDVKHRIVSSLIAAGEALKEANQGVWSLGIGGVK